MTPEHPTTDATPTVWSSRLKLNSLGVAPSNPEGAERPQAKQSRRGRTSKIEREIIWAVVVLYAGIIACFAGLHLYGLTLG